MTELKAIADDAPTEDVRQRIIIAAAALIAADGRDAATTRAVAAAAGVQAPTIYRLFGDKRALLDAAAEEGLAAYLAKKSAQPLHPDPVEAIRNGWDMHIAFGLAHPGLFAIMSAEIRPHQLSPSASKGQDILRLRINQVALAGRLRVSQQRAMEMLQSACNGTVLTLLGKPEKERDSGLSTSVREAIISAVTGEAAALATPGAKFAAVALRASLGHISILTAGEKLLLEELLHRVSDGN